MTRSNKHQKNHKTRIALVVSAILLFVIAGGYTYRSTYYTNHFLPNTIINDIDVSNKTVAEANELFNAHYAKQEFSITENNSDWKTLNLAEFGLQTDFTDELNKAKDEQNQWAWGMAYVSSNQQEQNIDLSINQEQLTAEVQQVKTELEELNTTRTTTQDATLTKGTDGFSITPEVVGDAIDAEKASQSLAEAITSGESQISLDDFKTAPSVTKDDPSLIEEMDALNKIATISANYLISGSTFQIPTETIMDWLSYKDGSTVIDEEKVKSYVTDLGTKYNTSTNSSTFKSTKRGEVQVPAGTLSWTIQTDSETEALIAALKTGEDFTRSPIVLGSASASTPLFSNTYIEVDLENQHMWYYKDGELKLETAIVSGKPASPTPTGVFYVWNKELNATLTGTNEDGTDYASPVNYWMPIDWNGVGIHDSSWQPAYGGDLWKTRGSHGCVNTPPDVMKQLYEMTEVGTPVIVL